MVHLEDFEAVQVSTLNTGFYRDASQKNARIVLIRTPKNIKASDLEGVKLELSNDGKHKNSVKGSFKATDNDGQEHCYKVTHSMAGSLAPVALALPSSNASCIRMEKAFDQVWNVSVVVDLPEKAAQEVDLEADFGGRSWKKIAQAQNLRMPLSATDVSLSSSVVPSKAESEKDSPKKNKKRKNAE